MSQFVRPDRYFVDMAYLDETLFREQELAWHDTSRALETYTNRMTRWLPYFIVQKLPQFKRLERADSAAFAAYDAAYAIAWTAASAKMDEAGIP